MAGKREWEAGVTQNDQDTRAWLRVHRELAPQW